MDQAEVRKKVEAVIEKYSAFGTICDVWLNPDTMVILDPRPPMARIVEEPYKIGDVFISAFAQLTTNEFRLAFVNSFDVLEQGDDDEPCSDN